MFGKKDDEKKEMLEKLKAYDFIINATAQWLHKRGLLVKYRAWLNKEFGVILTPPKDKK